MRLKDQLAFVRQNVKKNKVRTFMTILATAMGCTFLIVLASVGFGLQETVVEDTLEQQIVTKIDIHGYEKDDEGFRALTMDDIDYLESIDGVKAVTRRNHLQQITTYSIGDYMEETDTVAAHFPSEVKSGLELQEGRLPKENNEIVVGYHFPKYLHPASVKEEDLYSEDGQLKDDYQYKDELLGKSIDMTVNKMDDGKEVTRTIPLKVVGILEKPSREWMQERKVYISQDVLNEIAVFTGTPNGNPVQEDEVAGQGEDADTFDEVNVYATNLEAVKAISDQLDEANYATYSVVKEMEQINMLFTVAKAGLLLIGTIAILIASIGIYNTMTMAVTERAPDIGIMKAIGANPKTIKRIFLLESSCIGVIGAVIGVVVAYAISFLVNFGLPIIIEAAFGEQLPDNLKFSAIPGILIVISVGICLAVTILSGMRPAKRATQIDVLKAMRREV
ncbi:ABC transporter permease [Virgibacillus oceani]|uniref:ABC transporter permease YtrF n=1 Tax=Virgibacillus oceani TaxID=1479511 RepID=A0A917MCN2_9BACI|nr:ABC transporter permease [Virgibacillus oceani]GGG88790.1 ABC transporter permease YtrF [Virgibacillus oceani]